MNLAHYGLYFSAAQVDAAQQHADSEPIASAWQYLRGHQPHGAVAALWGGLRWRLTNSADSAAIGAEIGLRSIDPALMEGLALIDAVRQTTMLAHAFELTRDFAGFGAADQARWRDGFWERVAELNTKVYEPRIHERCWLLLLNLLAGIVLEREPIIEEACAAFQRIIAEQVSPRGYIESAVMGKDGGAMYRQIVSVSALALAAEAASHIGIDLWGYQVRGVAVTTTAVYPIYYFYTTEKWKWDADYPVEDVQALFREYGGYLEMVARRMSALGTTPSKDIQVVLADLRPVFDAYGGGLTTLTHALPEKKRRGLFG